MDKLPAHVRLDFSGMAEPWLNRQATSMVVHAFEQGRKVAIYTTLQGMRPDDTALLLDRFGDRISPETPWVIHLPDGDGQMTGWRCYDTYRATLQRILAFHRERHRAGLALMTMSSEGAVAAPLRDLVPEQLEAFVGISRAENLDRGLFTPSALVAQVRHTDTVMCASTPFFDHNAMLPNGDVLLCCMDYGQAHVLGNLLRQSYLAIHAGAAMGAIRAQAMAPAASDLICRRCHNAVCLSPQGGTHWRLAEATLWSNPDRDASPPPDAVPPPEPIRRFGRPNVLLVPQPSPLGPSTLGRPPGRPP